MCFLLLYDWLCLVFVVFFFFPLFLCSLCVCFACFFLKKIVILRVSDFYCNSSEPTSNLNVCDKMSCFIYIFCFFIFDIFLFTRLCSLLPFCFCFCFCFCFSWFECVCLFCLFLFLFCQWLMSVVLMLCFDKFCFRFFWFFVNSWLCSLMWVVNCVRRWCHDMQESHFQKSRVIFFPPPFFVHNFL